MLDEDAGRRAPDYVWKCDWKNVDFSPILSTKEFKHFYVHKCEIRIHWPFRQLRKNSSSARGCSIDFAWINLHTIFVLSSSALMNQKKCFINEPWNIRKISSYLYFQIYSHDFWGFFFLSFTLEVTQETPKGLSLKYSLQKIFQALVVAGIGDAIKKFGISLPFHSITQISLRPLVGINQAKIFLNICERDF